MSIIRPILLLLLLVAPAGALSQLTGSVDPWVLAGVPLAVSLFCYAAQHDDKNRAQAGARRTPEAWLHLGELLGGWPGSFIGQWQFRHKTGKGSYQAIISLIVVAHQFLAIEFLRGWPWTGQALAWAQNQLR
jgi:uncharacterized membrane protein YsdA (DUF1294 family)